MPEAISCYEDERRKIPAVIYDLEVSHPPLLEILTYQMDITPQNQSTPQFEDVVNETFFHLLKIQDRGNVRGLARLLLRNGMRTYVSGHAVSDLLTGNPRKYKNLWIIGIPWNDEDGDTYRSQFISSLENYARKRLLVDLDNEKVRKVRVFEENDKQQIGPIHNFKLVPTPEGIVQKAAHKILRPSDIRLTLNPRPGFKNLR